MKKEGTYTNIFSSIMGVTTTFVSDFGIVLGCKIYIKEITNRSVADKDGNLQEGDLIQKINNMSLDGLSLKEARKLLDSAKEKLDLMVKRDPYKSLSSTRTSPTQVKVENNQQVDDQRNNLASNQNLYVPPPSRKDEKNNLARADQLQKEEPVDTGQPPPRPPLPKDEGNRTSCKCISIENSHRKCPLLNVTNNRQLI